MQLEEQDWYVKRTHKGGEWKGPLQYEDSTGELMCVVVMLLTPHFNRVSVLVL